MLCSNCQDPVKRSQALQRAARDSKQRLVDAEELRLRGSAAVGAAGTPRGISTEVLEEEDVPGAGKFTGALVCLSDASDTGRQAFRYGPGCGFWSLFTLCL